MDRYVETVQEKRLIGLVNPMCVLGDDACGNQKDFQRSKCDCFLQQAWHQSFRDCEVELLSHVASALMPRLEPNRVKLVLHTWRLKYAQVLQMPGGSALSVQSSRLSVHSPLSSLQL